MIHIQVAMTERCNLKCIQCDLWRNRNIKNELTTKEWLDIFIRLKEWIGQPYVLDIGGGEPFIRKDLVEIIKFCSEKGIRTQVVTNATLLDENSIEILSKIETLTLNVSLDGINQQGHDYFRGKGVYQKLIDVLYSFKAKSRKCHIGIATILMRHNFREVLDIINKLVIEEKLADGQNLQTLWIPDVSGDYSKEWYKKSTLWPMESDIENLFAVIDKLLELKENGAPIWNSIEQIKFFKIYFSRLEEFISILPCDVGDRNFILNSQGEVLLCWNLNPVGDILKESPEAIWNSPLASQRRKEINACNMPCRILNCNFNLEKGTSPSFRTH
jgi:MoaA/NifB/PqqE/SkfB family radical SAM enzyme